MASTKLFDLGGHSARTKKAKTTSRPSRKVTRRDIERAALRQAGAWEYAKKLKEQPKDIERLLKAAGYGPGLAKGLSGSEAKQFEADLAFLGILPGRTAGTLPERLVAKYLWQKGLPYEGMGYSARPYRGWSFQVPLLGGRSGSGGGAVADIFLADRATFSGKPTAVRVNGLYWHTLPGAPAHDARQKQSLERAGYGVLDISDVEVETPGILDAMLRPVLL